MCAVLPLDEAVAYTTDAHQVRVRVGDMVASSGPVRQQKWIEFIGPAGPIAHRPRTSNDMNALFDGAFMRPRRILLAARAQRNGRVRIVIAFHLAGALPALLAEITDGIRFAVLDQFELDLLELPDGEPLTSLARDWLAERTGVAVSDEVTEAIDAVLAETAVS